MPYPKPNRPTYFDWFDFLVDGESLANKLVINPGFTPEDQCRENGPDPALGCVGVLQEYDGKYCDYPLPAYHLGLLLGNNPQSPFPLDYQGIRSGRIPLYQCFCGDYEHGVVCCRVDRIHSQTVVWHEIRQESDIGEEVNGEWVDESYSFEREWADIGPFFFDYEQYIKCLTELPPKPIDLEAS